MTRVDPGVAREAFAPYPSGVVAVLAAVDGEPVGMVASSFTVGVSADPPLVSLAVQRTSTSWPLLRTAPSLGVSAFAHDQHDLARRIAGPDRAHRFAGVELHRSGTSARFVEGAALWYDCVLREEVPAGDHVVALLEVLTYRVHDDRAPLLFHNSRFTGLPI